MDVTNSSFESPEMPRSGPSTHADAVWPPGPESLLVELRSTVSALEAEAVRHGEVEVEIAALEHRMEGLLAADHRPQTSRRLTSSAGRISRRKLIGWTGAGASVVGAALLPSGRAGAAGRPMTAGPGRGTVATHHSANFLASAKTPSSKIVVPPPTGSAATDMVNILTALSQAVAGSAVVFQAGPKGPYAIDQELPIPRGVRITGSGVSSEPATGGPNPNMPTLQQVAGTPLQCIAASSAFLSGKYGPSNPGKYPKFNKLYDNGKQRPQRNNPADSAIEVDHLAFDGQNGGTGSGNTSGHGVVLLSNGSDVHDCYFIDIANAGILVADFNYAGLYCTVQTFENRVHDNTIVNPGWFGIWNTYTKHSLGCTDGYVTNNVVIAPAQGLRTSGPAVNPSSGKYYEAIHMANAAGWWVNGNFLQACPGDGVFTNTTWGLHLVDNTVDGFGLNAVARGSYSAYNLTTAGQLKTHPGFIIGNLAVAYEGANPFAGAVTAPESATFAYFKVSMQTSAGSQAQPIYIAYLVESDNVAHQGSQPPGPIAGATIPKSNLKKVQLPAGSAAGVLLGMAISDAQGAILPGTTVTKVTPGSGGAPDVLQLSASATGATTGDSVSFARTNSIAWTYVNNLYNADMHVYRSNETATGTIRPTPVLSITSKPPPAGSTTPTITITDPSDFAGGLPLGSAAPPAEGQILLAATSGSAAWATSSGTGPPTTAAGGVLAGNFPNPTFADDAVTTITASGTYPLPAWATRLRITCVGAGGGGGGGSRLGGAGGAAGSASERIVETGGATSVDVVIGAGGPPGPGGSPTVAGADGGAGGATQVTIGSLVMTAGGGSGGGGAPVGSAGANGGAYGAGPGTTSPDAGASSGGGSGSDGGSPFFFSPGGGGGGGAAGSGLGGAGGGAGTSTAGGSAGASGSAAGASGVPGGSASWPGGPGGGGAGAANGGTGGAGGTGAGGFVVVEAIG